MRNDAITGALNLAIENADRLNQEAGMPLKNAIEKAASDTDLVDDYRYKSAMQLLKVYMQVHNVAARYFLTRSKKMRARAGR